MIRKHTLKGNIISATIGIGLGLLTIPFMLAERNARTLEHENHVQTEVISVAENVPETLEQEETATEIETAEVVETVKAEETTETTIEEPYFPYTQEDIYLVGNTVFHEVGVLRYRCTEEDAMKALSMTASCVVNRAKMNYMFLGRSIQEQVYNEDQYASYKEISNTKQDDVDEIFYQIAEEILQNGPVVSERLVFQSEFEQGEEVAHIDNQWFGLLQESEYETYQKSD